MNRWHKSACQTPDVFVEDGNQPRCRACNGVAPQPEVVAQLAPPKALSIPPDESAGRLNLWWPPSVPYSLTLDTELGLEVPPHPAATIRVSDGRQELALDVQLAFVAVENLIYRETLEPDEFRLLCLYSAPDANYPVHVSLETFRHDDCPEYETVSYTWGGEDEDSTPCRPVYVGPFWDMVLHTANCWNLLRHLRPWRGIRMVWVDAICINQANVAERNQQVARMSSIYQQALRVIVYLGSDLADSQGPSHESRQNHRPRHSLHHLATKLPPHTGVSWTELLQRRYFTRIWVVQELILARSSVFPIMGVDFWATSLGADTLDYGSDGLSESSDSNLSFDSESSDSNLNFDSDSFNSEYKDKEKSGDEYKDNSSRDDDLWLSHDGDTSDSGRYYETSDTESDANGSDEDDKEVLNENNKERVQLLEALQAHGTSSWFRRLGGGPRSGDNLYQLMRDTIYCSASDPRDKIYGLLGLVGDEMATSLSPDYRISLLHTLIGITAHVLINQKQPSVLLDSGISGDRDARPSWVPDWKSLWRRTERPGVANECLIGNPGAKYRFDKRQTMVFSSRRTKSRPEAEQIARWNKGTRISPSTGALSITLVHMAHIEGSRTRLIRDVSDSSVITFQAWTRRVMLQLRTSGSKCHSLPRLPPGRIDLFRIHNEHQSGIILFMRKQAVHQLGVSCDGYELLWSCGYTSLFWSLCSKDLELDPTLGPGQNPSTTQVLDSQPSTAVAEVPKDKESDSTVKFKTQTIFLHETFGSVRARAWARCDWRVIADRRPDDNFFRDKNGLAHMAQIFPGNPAVLRELLPVFQSLVGRPRPLESRKIKPGFIDAYRQCFRHELAKYRPKINRPYVVFTIDGKDEVLLTYERRMPGAFSRWEWLPDQTAKTRQWQQVRRRRFWGDNARVKVRMSIVAIQTYLQSTPISRALEGLKLQLVQEVTGETESQFMQRENTDADFKKFWRPWPPELVDTFGVDAVPQQVLIL